MEKRDITVVKVGTDTLIDGKGAPREDVIQSIIAHFKREALAGRQMVLVTSGAVRLGRNITGDPELSRAVAASVGQPDLFTAYQREAKRQKSIVAELLFSREYMVRRKQFLDLQRNFAELFARGILPVVNENDALVADTDWSFGDNDSLAAALAISLGAKRLIIMTHVDGLFEKDPTLDPKAKLVPEVGNLSDVFLKYCSPTTSGGGRGGMLSKLKAARICTAIGIEVYIVNGLKADNLEQALEGGAVGTVCRARAIDGKVSNRDRWILATKNSAGSIEIDDGAVQALRRGKSLLAVGARKIYGQFEAKEVIAVMDRKAHAIAYGIVDHSSHEIEEILKGDKVHDQQLIHADNIFLIG